VEHPPIPGPDANGPSEDRLVERGIARRDVGRIAMQVPRVSSPTHGSIRGRRAEAAHDPERPPNLKPQELEDHQEEAWGIVTLPGSVIQELPVAEMRTEQDHCFPLIAIELASQ
jgi:hypothetical protein